MQQHVDLSGHLGVMVVPIASNEPLCLVLVALPNVLFSPATCSLQPVAARPALAPQPACFCRHPAKRSTTLSIPNQLRTEHMMVSLYRVPCFLVHYFLAKYSL